MASSLGAVERHSVQTLPDASDGVVPFRVWQFQGRGDILPAWGTRHRERVLLTWDRHERNWMWQSAVAGLAARIASAPNELRGGPRLTGYFRNLLDNADFGAGWQVFIKKVVRDYLRHDVGAFIEVIAPGNPRRAPTGRVVGLAHLDSMRCFPTGDPEYPVAYHSQTGAIHLLHHTRVIHLADMPDGDTANPGYGLCALSRAIAIAQREIHMGRYVAAQLDDKPAPGILIVRGMQDAQLQAATRAYWDKRNTDSGSMWGSQLVLNNPAANNRIEVEQQSFSNAPPSWDFEKYTTLNVNSMALALGVDVQELWQLASGSLGSGSQSEILHAKSQGRTLGDLLTAIERAINFHVLPPALTFEFKQRDPYEAQASAATANLWADFAAKTSAVLSADEVREVLSNQVEAVADAITDADGQVVRLYDADPEGPEQIADDTDGTTGEGAVIADDTDGAKAAPDNTTFDSVTYNGVTVQASPVRSSSRDDKKYMRWVRRGDNERLVHWGQPGEQMERDNPEARANFNSRHDCASKRDPFAPGFWACWAWQPTADVRSKAIQSTRLDFEAGFEDILAEARVGNINRRRFGVLLRALVARMGRRAYTDGLTDGGVTTEALEGDDLARYTVLVAEQSQYITNLGRVLFRDDGVTDGQAAVKPALWFNKSIQPFYDAGKLSADRNGMYEWVLGATEEHCDTCLGLNGQRHRLKAYHNRDLVPKSSRLQCGGYQCDCRLQRTTQPARGRLDRVKTKEEHNHNAAQ